MIGSIASAVAAHTVVCIRSFSRPQYPQRRPRFGKGCSNWRHSRRRQRKLFTSCSYLGTACRSAALVQMSVQESTASASDGVEELRQKLNEAENEFSKHD